MQPSGHEVRPGGQPPDELEPVVDDPAPVELDELLPLEPPEVPVLADDEWLLADETVPALLAATPLFDPWVEPAPGEPVAEPPVTAPEWPELAVAAPADAEPIEALADEGPTVEP